ncbi:MAG: phosphoribosylformylglycinamidine synthase subunit PurL [Candidatus Thorarchaeota archaeon]|nr:phosphoribosylformylglycinamidine synthase subunit PurL [Candidatus Thorarchaeota archaeon]
MISKDELQIATKTLGRDFTETELRMIEALWSEHCSYKSSKRWFYLFKTTADNVALGVGEGAGLFDIGGGYYAGVSMDSHNHPSQIDPYNGAGSGIGGTIRNVISQGCKAVGLMNCLRFGHPQKPKNALSLSNAVRGISDYGNSVGIPMVGGEMEFDESFEDNCLVNIVCIGCVKSENVVRSIARTPGHHIVIFGSKTGCDGVGGVIFASNVISDSKDWSTSAIQIGDSLAEKVLIDTLTELLEEHLIDGLQDIGGGGLAAAAGDLAHSGGTGVEIELDKVPTRGVVNPSDIIISESQERMLAIIAPTNMDRVKTLLEKNDTPYAVIGKVTDDGYYTAKYEGEIIAKLPISLLVDGVLIPERVEGKIPSQTDSLSWFKEPDDYGSAIMNLISSVNICDRSWIYSQYDQHVQSNTVVDIGQNAGVLEFPNGRLLAFTSDCNSFWCKLDPQVGTANSAAESLRNIVSMGARPIFIANCLNFGSPEKPDSYAQFVESVRGLGRFSHDFNIPIIGGNVSLYNEALVDGQNRRINPSPQIMLAGIFKEKFSPIKRNLVTPWANIFLVGETFPELNGSEFQRVIVGEVKGEPPKYRPNWEKKTMDAILESHDRGLIRSCNNVGRGGIAIALMKMALRSEYGFKLNMEYIPGTVNSLAQSLFSETSSRYLAEVTESNQPEFLSILEKHELATCELGLTTLEPTADFGRFTIPLEKAKMEFSDGLGKYLG